MTVVCSWCLSEGQTTFLGLRGSKTDFRISHGMCERHIAQIRIGKLNAGALPSSLANHSYARVSTHTKGSRI
ncbi:MAG: hypothetical protein NPIRA02_21130 [Nitrospirales bacterium]|nr:MAG: hypothetical protein NPIRA02_21130 [Nitrospirales bacterium]